MAAFDIFNNSAFTMVEMTSAVNKNPYRPGFLGGLNLFTPKPIRTTAAAIELKDGTLNLIQTSPRGAPLAEGDKEKRNIYYRETVRVAKGHTITSDEIQNVRAFGAESELESMISVVANRLNGPTGLLSQVELTWENMRLGAVQGIVTDADASTIVDWFSVLGQSQPAETNFDLANASPASGAVRKLCNQTVRGIMRALGGLWVPNSSYIMALCGDAFFDDLTAHSEIRATYLNQIAAAELRQGNAFEQFSYGGITWVNYRGTDDNTTVAVGTDKCKFVPVNVPGLFDVAYSPSESITYVNTPGQPLYAMMVMDDARQMWARPEVYSYPLFICTRPAALFRGKRA